VRGVGIGGVKGFPGGFGRGTLEAWGEGEVKAFVRAAVDEALKLERALTRLRTQHKLALLHYAPIRATVEGEPLEIFPYLGCGRLEEPLNRFGVTAVFHGHAHRGAAAGRTTTGIPVYNVALPLLRRERPDQPPLLILELPAATTDGAAASDGALGGTKAPSPHLNVARTEQTSAAARKRP
jgi:Icc-related predicted phosphoesterase